MLSDTGKAGLGVAGQASPRGCPVARPGRLLLACGCRPPVSGRAGLAVPWRAFQTLPAPRLATAGAPAQEARREVQAEVRHVHRPEHHGRTAGAGRQCSRHGRPVHGRRCRRRGGAVRAPADALPAAAIGRASHWQNVAHVSGGHGRCLAMPAEHEVPCLVLHGLRILHRRKVLPAHLSAHLHEHASAHPWPVRPQMRPDGPQTHRRTLPLVLAHAEARSQQAGS